MAVFTEKSGCCAINGINGGYLMETNKKVLVKYIKDFHVQ